MLGDDDDGVSEEYRAYYRMCARGDVDGVRAMIEGEPDETEKEMRWISCFHIMYREWVDFEVALKWGWEYLEEVRQRRGRGCAWALPDWKVLKGMAILYERLGEYETGAEVCEVALGWGIWDDWTKSGFKGRRQRLLKWAGRRAEEGCEGGT